VWHSGLSTIHVQMKALQHRVMCNIFQENKYTASLIRAELNMLESRRDQLTERFFQRNVLQETSCLHYVLLVKCDPSVMDRLRHLRNFETLKSRTVKFKFKEYGIRKIP